MYLKVAETHQKLMQMKQEEGAEKAELHHLWKKMLWLLKDSTQNQISVCSTFPEGLLCARPNDQGGAGRGGPSLFCLYFVLPLYVTIVPVYSYASVCLQFYLSMYGAVEL